MSIGVVPTAGAVQKFDSSATPNTLALRDSSGGLTNAIDTCTELIVNGPVVLKWNPQTASYVMTAVAGGDCVVYIDCTGGARNVTLPNPAALGAGHTVFVIKKDGANNATILPSAVETINGAASKVLSVQYSVCQLFSDGTNWTASTTTS